MQRMSALLTPGTRPAPAPGASLLLLAGFGLFPAMALIYQKHGSPESWGACSPPHKPHAWAGRTHSGRTRAGCMWAGHTGGGGAGMGLNDPNTRADPCCPRICKTRAWLPGWEMDDQCCRLVLLGDP